MVVVINLGSLLLSLCLTQEFKKHFSQIVIDIELSDRERRSENRV